MMTPKNSTHQAELSDRRRKQSKMPVWFVFLTKRKQKRKKNDIQKAYQNATAKLKHYVQR